MTNPKNKIIKYLLAAAVTLLIINIAIDSYKKPKKENPVSELSVLQIETVFFTVLDEYGIELKWITRKKYKSSEDDSVNTEYIIKTPSDMPVPLIIKDINKIIEKNITGFVSEEKKIFGLTEIRIYTNEILKLKAILIPDKQIIRKRNDLSFVINDAFDLNETKFNDFLSVHYPLSCSVIPGKESIIKADSLKDYTKEYILLLNDDISDSKMKFRPEFQNDLLLGSIQNIITSFRDAKAFIIDEKSALYNSSIYRIVKDDFKKNKILLIPISNLIALTGNDNSELVAKFHSFSEDTTGVNQKIFITSFDNFQKIESEIEHLKKRGHKVIPVSKTFLVDKHFSIKSTR